MAKIATPLLLALLFLVVADASATTLQEICQGTSDAKYCVTLLKGTVSSTPTDFKSPVWKAKATDQARLKVEAALNYIQRKNDPQRHDTCLTYLPLAINSIKAGDLLEASSNIGDCADSYDGDGKVVQDAKRLADEAYTATNIVNEVIKKA
ncbi:OLC1v1020355C1 [Oldenlandia corymbosa var. corymbosa]|uniref:OLC1v1020355C1 n=1 Tax=Oldenlandia corymbosa var. corymbosa TaxID=529605 RepID=A0AAV1EGC9_OLDCO|nr:OLC1v1020355C1 [Oldenlandia corymbosa var. corymbosa]